PPQPLRRGHDPAVLRGARLPRGFADPRDHHRPQRRPADLVVQPDEPQAEGARLRRLLQAEALAAHPPGGPRRVRSHRPPTVPGAQGRALPRLQEVRERHGSLIGRTRGSKLLAVAVAASAFVPATALGAKPGPRIDVLSNRADLISAGDALVAIRL